MHSSIRLFIRTRIHQLNDYRKSTASTSLFWYNVSQADNHRGNHSH